jgi:hypothetical protein
MKLFYFGIFLVASISANGQTILGLKLGLNYNNEKLRSDDPNYPDLADPKIGFNGGIFLKINLNEKIAFIPELQYVQKGIIVNDRYRNRIHYIEIPAMMSLMIVRNLEAEVGLNPGLRMWSTAKVDNTKITTTNSHPLFDFGISTGIRIKLMKGFGIAGRYVWGLTPSGESDAQQTNVTTKVYNRNLLVSITYTLKEIKK